MVEGRGERVVKLEIFGQELGRKGCVLDSPDSEASGVRGHYMGETDGVCQLDE